MDLVGTGLILLAILAVVVWLGCAYYCYVQARDRGRRPLLWGVLGIIFGPFALGALLLLPSGR